MTLQAAAASPDLQIVAVQDVDPEARQRAAQRAGIDRMHGEYEALLAEDLDLVILCTPNDLHAPQAILALQSGRHCLVQKPMASDLAAAASMRSAAQASPRKLGVLMLELGRPLWHQLRSLVRAGWFGEVGAVQATMAHSIYYQNAPAADHWRREVRRVGGGPFAQLAVHWIDLVRWLLGEEVVEVSALRSRGRTVFAEDTTVAVARLQSGVLAEFLASYTFDAQRVELYGTKGSFVWTQHELLVRGNEACSGACFDYASPGTWVRYAAADLVGPAEQQAALEMHGRFARWTRGEDDYPCTAAEAYEDLRVVAAVEQSVAEGRPISLDHRGTDLTTLRR